MTRRRALMASVTALVKLVATSVSGLVSFITNVIRPVKVTCEFSPVQANGTPSPDNQLPISGWTECKITRSNKNLFVSELEQGAINANNGNNTSGTNRLRSKGYVFLKAGVYTFSAQEACYVMLCLYDLDKSFITPYDSKPGTIKFLPQPATITLTRDYYVRFVVRNSSNTTVHPEDISNIQFETGEDATSYIAAEINIADNAEYEAGYYDNKGVPTSSNNVKRTPNFLPVVGGQTYYYYFISDSTKFFRIHEYDADQTWLRQVVYTGDFIGSFTASANAAYIRWSLPNNAEDITISTGQIASVSWQSEAGTLYGGTVTLNEDGSADLVADRIVVDIPNLRWSKYGSDQLYFCKFGYKIDTSKVVCDIYKTVEENFPKPIDYAVGSSRSASYNQMLFIHDSRYETIEDFKAGSANTQLIINAESPQTYHFDNIGQLNSFLGQNNIWHDMNGGITVEYWNKQ